MTKKRIDISSSRPARRPRGSATDWLAGCLAVLTILLISSIVVGGLLWVALKIWGSLASMM